MNALDEATDVLNQQIERLECLMRDMRFSVGAAVQLDKQSGHWLAWRKKDQAWCLLVVNDGVNERSLETRLICASRELRLLAIDAVELLIEQLRRTQTDELQRVVRATAKLKAFCSDLENPR